MARMSLEKLHRIVGSSGAGNRRTDRPVVGQIMETLIEQTDINQKQALRRSRGI